MNDPHAKLPTMEKHHFESSPNLPMTCKACGISRHSPYHHESKEGESSHTATAQVGSSAAGAQRSGGQSPKSLAQIFRLYDTYFQNLSALGLSFDEVLKPSETQPGWAQLAPIIRGKLAEGEPKEYTAWKTELAKLNSGIIKHLMPPFTEQEAKIRELEQTLLHPMDGSGQLINWPHT